MIRHLQLSSHFKRLDTWRPVGVGVYFLVQTGTIVYVGQSTEISRRVSEHISMGKKFDDVYFIPVSPSDLTTVEAAFIRYFKPSYNDGIISEITNDDKDIIGAFLPIKNIVRLRRPDSARDEGGASPAHSLTIGQWCMRHGISRGMFYKMKKIGEAPRTMKIGTCTRISHEADREWVRAREAETERQIGVG